MKLSEIDYNGAPVIDGYGPGFLRVSGEVIEGPALVREAGASAWGGLGDIAALTALAGEVDVVLLGTGALIAHAPTEMREQLEAVGIGLEVMASPAACRTYNVLLSEGRRIAAAILPIE